MPNNSHRAIKPVVVGRSVLFGLLPTAYPPTFHYTLGFEDFLNYSFKLLIHTNVKIFQEFSDLIASLTLFFFFYMYLQRLDDERESDN